MAGCGVVVAQWQSASAMFASVLVLKCVCCLMEPLPDLVDPLPPQLLLEGRGTLGALACTHHHHHRIT